MSRAACLLLLLLPLGAALPAGAGRACPQPLAACLAEKKPLFEKRGVLGFLWSRVGSEDAAAPPEARYVVRSVPRGYPAHAAGLRDNDVLLAMNGRPLASVSKEELERRFQGVAVGDRVRFLVLRRGSRLTISIEAGRPAPESVEAWLGQHVRDEHSEAEHREYLRQLRRNRAGRAFP